MAAHHDLEGLVMDREVRRLRDDLSRRFSEVLYNGLCMFSLTMNLIELLICLGYSPEREFIHQAIISSQRFTTGIVKCSLYKGNIVIEGRSSDYALYDSELSSVS